MFVWYTRYKESSLEEAVRHYSDALTKDPDNTLLQHSVILTNRAVVLAKLGRTDEAITDCTLAIDAHPG